MAVDEKPKRFRLADPTKKHVRAKPARPADKPKWDGDKPARAPRSRSAAGDDRPAPRKRYDSDDRPPPARGPRREYGDAPRGPRRDSDGPPRGPRREFDGPKREWTERPPSRGPHRDFDGPPRGRSAGPKREWTDRPPRRDFGDRAPRPSTGGGNAEVMEALTRIEAAIKDLTKRITLIENQLEEIFEGEDE